MSLKYEVNDLEGLDESIHGMYEKTDTGYRLKVDGMPEPEDVSGLKSALEKEREKRRKAIEDREAAEEAARVAAEEKARKSGDVEALEKSWQVKYDKLQKEAANKESELNGILKNNIIHATAQDLANANALPGSAKVLLPAFEGRIDMEFRDGKAVPVVLDADGKPSAMTINELVEEVRKDEAYAPVLVASKATGGGATGSKGSGAAPNVKADMGGSKEERTAAISQKMQTAA